MKAFKIIFLLLAFTALLPTTVEAQRDLYDWQISPYAGFFTRNNDIEIPDSTNQYAYGLRVEHRLGNDFTFGVNFSHLHFKGASEKDISSGLIGLGYHWDNGYLFSKRAAVSIFHRLEIGYATRKNEIDKLNVSSRDFAFGFENGLKFRFGDRVSAELALEILGSKASLTEGDIAKNIRYNVWKLGLNYHFGSRKSKFVAPVFIPSSLAGQPREMTKMDSKMADLWLLDDSVKIDADIEEMRDIPLLDTAAVSQKNKSVTRADSLSIFMHFDSLYQRRVTPLDTMRTMADSLGNDKVIRDSVRTSEMDADSIDSMKAHVDDTLKAHIDTVGTSKMRIDSVVSSGAKADTVDTSKMRVDTLNKSKAKVDTLNTSKILTDSVKTSKAKADTVGNSKVIVDSVHTSKAKVDTTAEYSQKVAVQTPPVQSDTLNAKTYKEKVRADSIVNRVDTVYIERSDTTSQSKNFEEQGRTRVDTVYVIPQAKTTEASKTQNQKDAEKLKASEIKQDEKKDTSQKERDKNTEELQKSIDRQNKLIENQSDQISENQNAMERMAREDKRNTNDLGKVLAAGAAGTAVGAVAASSNKTKPDTVFVESAAAKAKVDSLQMEIDRLNNLSPGDSGYVANPPIGHYYSGYSSAAESGSVMNDSLTMAPDSVKMQSDAIPSGKDSIPNAKENIPVPSTTPAIKDTIPKNAPSSKAETTKPVEKSASANTSLVASYPVVCNFDLNSTSLESASQPELDQVVQDLKNDPVRKVVLTGHTDKSGNAAYNLTLSKKRAQSVQDYLTTKGIDASRISIESKGAEDATENYNENARRVDLQIVN